MLLVKEVSIVRDLGWSCTYRVKFNQVPPRATVKFLDISENSKAEDKKELTDALNLVNTLMSIKHIQIDNVNEASELMLNAMKLRKEDKNVCKGRKSRIHS